MNGPEAIGEGARAVSLRGRERVALTIAIVALALTMNPLNRQVRFWVRDQLLGGGIPFWLDNMLIMVTFLTLFWGTIGLLLLGRRGVGLAWPERPREAWLVAVLSGLAFVGLIAGALALSGKLAFQLALDLPVAVANLVSNFEEELIGRGVILGLLLVAVGRRRAGLAALIEAALFCQGHLYYPLPMLVVVFVGGLFWCWMTLRYRSILPAFVSHMVADVVASVFLVS